MRTPTLLTIALALAGSGCASVVAFDLDYQYGGRVAAERELASVPQPSREPTSLLGRVVEVAENGFLLDPHDDGELSRAFGLDASTPVTWRGQAVSPDALQPGADVRVTFRPQSKAVTRVDLVEVLAPAAVAAPEIHHFDAPAASPRP